MAPSKPDGVALEMGLAGLTPARVDLSLVLQAETYNTARLVVQFEFLSRRSPAPGSQTEPLGDGDWRVRPPRGRAARRGRPPRRRGSGEVVDDSFVDGGASLQLLPADEEELELPERAVAERVGLRGQR